MSNSYLALLKSIDLHSKSSRQKPISGYGDKINPSSSFNRVPNATVLQSPSNVADRLSATNASATGSDLASIDATQSEADCDSAVTDALSSATNSDYAAIDAPTSNSYMSLLKSIGVRSKSSRQNPVYCYKSKENPASPFGSVPDATALPSSLNVTARHSAIDACAIASDPSVIDAPPPAIDGSATSVDSAAIDASSPSNSYRALLKSSRLRSKSSKQKPVSCFGSNLNATSSFGSVPDDIALPSSLNVTARHSAIYACAIAGDPAVIDAPPPTIDGSATSVDSAATDASSPSNSYRALLRSSRLQSKSSRQQPVSCYGSNVNPTSSVGSIPDARILRTSLNIADRYSDIYSSESGYDPSSTDALPLAARADFAATDAESAAGVVLAETEAQPPLSTGTEEWNLVQYQLLLILHANKCPSNENQANEKSEQCPFSLLTNKTLHSHCSTMRQVLRHMSTCRGRQFCNDLRCYSSAQITSHWINCRHLKCHICTPLRRKIRRNQRKISRQVRKKEKKQKRKEEKRQKRNRSKDSDDCNRNLRLKKSN